MGIRFAPLPRLSPKQILDSGTFEALAQEQCSVAHQTSTLSSCPQPPFPLCSTGHDYFCFLRCSFSAFLSCLCYMSVQQYSIWSLPTCVEGYLPESVLIIKVKRPSWRRNHSSSLDLKKAGPPDWGVLLFYFFFQREQTGKGESLGAYAFSFNLFNLLLLLLGQLSVPRALYLIWLHVNILLVRF